VNSTHRPKVSVKYATADTQILATKGQKLKVAVFGVSAVVSAAFLGLPANLGCIFPRICEHFGVSASGSGAPNICIFHCKVLHEAQWPHCIIHNDLNVWSSVLPSVINTPSQSITRVAAYLHVETLLSIHRSIHPPKEVHGTRPLLLKTPQIQSEHNITSKSI
jgi:hypothetical protein